MTTAPLLLALAAADLFGPAAGLELTYTGRLAPVAVSDKTAGDKGFSVTWFLPHAEADSPDGLFVVTEDSAALPWPTRFGFGPAHAGGPRIGYRFADRSHEVRLPGATLNAADRLATENEVLDGPHRLTVAGEKQIDGRDCRIVESATNFGKEATIAVEKATGLIVRCEQTVFLGRGDRFRLTLELTDARQLDSAEAASRQKLADSLRAVAAAIGQAERDPAADLPADSLARVTAITGPLTDSAKGTPFESLAAAIARNVDEQHARREGVAGLTKKAVGSPAPPLGLKGLDGTPLDPASYKGKVVVLHFWEYDNDSLAAPYGQVGYLDFLHRKRGKDGLAVVGVAVNPAFGDPAARNRAARSAKNLAAFMNLGYPVADDDGTLLRAFGDPRPLGAPLPLWVVIDARGVVRAYKAGLYDLKQNEGLAELDSHIAELLKENRPRP